MTDIGNRSAYMSMRCLDHNWPVPAEGTAKALQLHVAAYHEGEATFAAELVAVCTCKEIMKVTSTKPTGGGLKDWLECPACGNTGHAYRRA